MKRMISAFLVLVLCMSMVLCASAASETYFVVDEIGYLAGSEITTMNQLAQTLYGERGVGIYFVYTEADSLQDYDISTVVSGMEDYFVMMENETQWCTFAAGLGESIDAQTAITLRAVYDEADTYAGGVVDFLYAAAECFPYIADTPEGDILYADGNVLFDEADLLSREEEAALTARLLDAGRKYDAQIVVSTVAAMDGGSVDRFVEYLYDRMQFGYGENRDGVLLLVCMDPREYRILSNGFVADAIDTDAIDVISEEIVFYLSRGRYADAFDAYAEQCEYYLDGYMNGYSFNVTEALGISLLIGIVIGVIVVFILKGQLKTVRKQNQANVYIRNDSIQIRTCNDFFLYRDVRRTKKETSKSSSSRSGSSRNIGGGSF